MCTKKHINGLMVLETAPWIKSFPIVTSVYLNWQLVSKAYTYFWKRAAITKAAILPQHIYAVCRCVLMWYYVVEWQCFWVTRYLPALCFVKGKVNIIYCTGNILITFFFNILTIYLICFLKDLHIELCGLVF